MPIVNLATMALATYILKDMRKLQSSLRGLANHLKLVKDLVQNPAIHQSASQKIALDALKKVSNARIQADKLQVAIGKATEKLPKEQRKSMRRDMDRMMSSLEKDFQAIEKNAKALIAEINRLARSKVIDTPADGAFQITMTALLAVITAWKAWKLMRKRTMR